MWAYFLKVIKDYVNSLQVSKAAVNIPKAWDKSRCGTDLQYGLKVYWYIIELFAWNRLTATWLVILFGPFYTTAQGPVQESWLSLSPDNGPGCKYGQIDPFNDTVLSRHSFGKAMLSAELPLGSSLISCQGVGGGISCGFLLHNGSV